MNGFWDISITMFLQTFSVVRILLSLFHWWYFRNCLQTKFTVKGKKYFFHMVEVLVKKNFKIFCPEGEVGWWGVIVALQYFFIKSCGRWGCFLELFSESKFMQPFQRYKHHNVFANFFCCQDLVGELSAAVSQKPFTNKTRLRSLESSSSWQSVTNGGLSFGGDNELELELELSFSQPSSHLEFYYCGWVWNMMIFYSLFYRLNQ